MPEPAMAVLSLLPDPYTLARENSYVWTAHFVDSTEDASVLFNRKLGPLDLNSLKVLGPGERQEVVLQREEGVASLASLARDLLARLQLEVASLPDNHLPKTLKTGLLKLTRCVGISDLSFNETKPHLLFSGTMRRLISQEPGHVTVARKYICDGTEQRDLCTMYTFKSATTSVLTGLSKANIFVIKISKESQHECVFVKSEGLSVF